MAEPDNEIDEVALNVLLAEGLDLPTAWQASRRDSGAEPAALPDESSAHEEPQSSTLEKSASGFVWGVLVFLGMMVPARLLTG